jgi:hypothetical protein
MTRGRLDMFPTCRYYWAMKKQPITLPVTVAAVMKRVNRLLAREYGRKLIKNRGYRYADRLPEWVEIDFSANFIVGGTDDLEGYARELGVLREWEYMADT